MSLITFLVLRNRALERAQMIAGTNEFITTDELKRNVNIALGEWHDLLIQQWGQRYSSQDEDVPTVADQPYVDLPRTMYKMWAVDLDLGLGSGPREMLPYQADERLKWGTTTGWSEAQWPQYDIREDYIYLIPTPTAVHTMTLHYAEAFDDLVTDGATVEDYNGWSEYVVLRTAIMLKEKEQTDTTVLERDLERLRQRITLMAGDRDIGHPRYVQRRRHRRSVVPSYRWRQ